MVYLEKLTDSELIELAKKENIFLEIKYNRNNLIKKLEKKGYNVKEVKRNEISKIKEKNKIDIVNNSSEVNKNSKTNKSNKINNINEVKNENNLKKQVEVEEKVEEIDFLQEIFFNYRSRSYYRNYASKKLIKKLSKKYRAKSERGKEILSGKYNYRKFDKEIMRRREAETEINKSKFDKGAEYKGNFKETDIYFDKAPLPTAYFTDEVVLMPKNPTTLYMYWEVKEETFQKLLKDKGIEENLVIKLFKDGQEYKKLTRHERIGNYFINNVEANKNYEVFLGYEDNEGNFLEVAHSNTAIVPTNTVSSNREVLWGTVKEDKNTNQIIKYINSPILTDENIEFLEISKNRNNYDDENMKEIFDRLNKISKKIGSSEMLVDVEEILKSNVFSKSNISGIR